MSVKEELHRFVDSLPEADAANLLNELALRSELDHADEQLARGAFTDYDQETIRSLADKIKFRGKSHLAQEHKTAR